MTTTGRSPQQVDVVGLRDDLAQRLSAIAEEKTARWFTNYLKGAITYRGVKSAAIREVTTKAWGPKLRSYGLEDQLRVVEAVMAQPFAEDKFAAIFWLELEVSDAVRTLDLVERCFDSGHIFDWSTTDWLCVRVLDPLVRDGFADRVAGWRAAPCVWQRRASVVSFRSAAAAGDHHDTVARIIDDLLPSDDRFIHTGIGWLLADASKNHPAFASDLFDAHLPDLSLEVCQRHTKHLPKSRAQALLKRKKAMLRDQPAPPSASEKKRKRPTEP